MKTTMIPDITDPLGRYWNQPNPNEILIIENYAVMTLATLKKLPEYSSSIPSGKYKGKMWRSWVRKTLTWYLRWYAPDLSNPTMLIIPSKEVVILNYRYEILY